MARTQKSQKPGEADATRRKRELFDEAIETMEGHSRQRGDYPVDTDEKAVIDRAAAVIGDRDGALRWLGTPVRALGYATPISKLGDEAGVKEVMAVLAA